MRLHMRKTTPLRRGTRLAEAGLAQAEPGFERGGERRAKGGAEGDDQGDGDGGRAQGRA